jgi:hypothetical protein
MRRCSSEENGWTYLFQRVDGPRMFVESSVHTADRVSVCRMSCRSLKLDL